MVIAFLGVEADRLGGVTRPVEVGGGGTTAGIQDAEQLAFIGYLINI